MLEFEQLLQWTSALIYKICIVPERLFKYLGSSVHVSFYGNKLNKVTSQNDEQTNDNDKLVSLPSTHRNTDTPPGQRISGSSIRFCITDGATVSLTRYTRSLHHCDVSGHHAGQDFPLESTVEHKLTTRVDKQNPN